MRPTDALTVAARVVGNCIVPTALALCVAIRPAFAQDGTTSSTPKNGAVPAMSPVEVKLESASIVDPLPFDVPFRFTGDAPAGTTELVVAYARTTDVLTRRSTCTRNAKTKQSRAGCDTWFANYTADSLDWIPAAQGWVPLGGPNAETKPFSITIPALDAEQYYRFRFTLSRAATADQETAFRNAVTPSIDGLVAAFIPDAKARTLTDPELAQLWADMRSRLQQAVAPGMAIKPTSIFSNDTSWKKAKDDFNKAIYTSVIQPQVRRNSALASLDNVYRALGPRLVAIVSDDALDRLLSAASSDTALRKLLVGHDAAVALAALSPAEADRLAHGDDAAPTVPAPAPLGDLRDSAAIMQTTARYTQLRDRLHDLRGVLEKIQGERKAVGRLIKSKALAAADTTGAFALVKGGDLSPLETAAGQASVGADDAAKVAAETPVRQHGIDAVVLLAAIYARDIRYIEATTTGDESTVYSRYVSADAGYAYAFGMRTAVPFIGTNIYFRPINKNAPLSQRGGFGRRFSITVGLTLKSVADDQQTRRDLPQLGKALVFGAGLRVRQSLRLMGGTVLLEKKDAAHPLDTSFHPGFDGFAALSFDIDVQSLPAKLGDLFK